MTEQEAQAVQEEFYELAHKFLEDKGLEDRYGIAFSQAIQYTDEEGDKETGGQMAFIWGGEKGLHAKVGIEAAEGLFKLAIEIIEDISKTSDIAKMTIMSLFAAALSQVRAEKKAEVDEKEEAERKASE